MADIKESHAGTIKFDSISNFRDVAIFTNAVSGERRLKPGLLYRSARPDYATPKDREVLQSQLKINSIIDLRSKTEQLQIATPTAATPPFTAAANTSSSPPTVPAPAPAPPTPLPIKTHRINLNGPLFSLHQILSLPRTSAAKLIYLFTTGHRIPAIRILSTVIGPRGLIGLAEDSLTSSWREIRSIFTLLADDVNWPVLVHCTQGKDRTGLTVLLILRLCGVGRHAIDEDYMFTQSQLVDEREGRIKEITEVGMPESFADCEKGWVGATCDFIEKRWGGVEEYLEWCGVKREEVQAVKRTLIADGEEGKA